MWKAFVNFRYNLAINDLAYGFNNDDNNGQRFEHFAR